MDIMSILQFAIQYLRHVGPAGKIISLIGFLLVGIPGVITALVAVWHSVVAFFMAMSIVLPGLKGFAQKLKIEQDYIDSKSSVLLNLINRLSAILPPVQK